MVRAGQRLKEIRLQKGLSLEDVEKQTKIKRAFLQAIERGDYHALPSAAYAKGFVQNYGSFLGLSTREIMPLFKREFDEKKEVKVLPEGFTRQRPLPTKRFRIRRTVLIVIGIVILIGCFIFFQYRHAFFPPSLHVIEPRENSTTMQDLTVLGQTDPDTTVTVNGETVNVGEHGDFRKDIEVFPGKNTITVTSVNRFGKTTTIERHIDTK